MEIPAIVRPAGAGDDEEQADLLVEAVIENDLRVDLDPLEPSRIALDASFGWLDDAITNGFGAFAG